MINLQNSRPFIIAIDGPAGSGKTTSAKLAAQRLNFTYIDTGAMYRAVALAVLDKGFRTDDEKNICGMIPEITIDIRLIHGTQTTLLNGHNVDDRIRTPELSKAASEVSKIKCVREAMVDLQRNAGKKSHGAVLEGRDIGSVVFPDAPVKIYLVADIEARALRRQKQLSEAGTFVSLEELIKQITDRDRNDSERENSPLQKAVDAIEIDTSHLTIEQQVSRIVDLARERMNKLEKEVSA